MHAESGLRAGMRRPWTPRASDAALNRSTEIISMRLKGASVSCFAKTVIR